MNEREREEERKKERKEERRKEKTWERGAMSTASNSLETFQ